MTTPLPRHIQIIQALANIQPLILRNSMSFYSWGSSSSGNTTPQWVCTFCGYAANAASDQYGQAFAINPADFIHDPACVWQLAHDYRTP